MIVIQCSTKAISIDYICRQDKSLSVPRITVQQDDEAADEEDKNIIEEARVDMFNDMNLIKKEIIDIKHILVVIETRAKMFTLST